MPELQPKQIQKELGEGRYWPVYWIHGAERMKSRELLRRIRRSLFPEAEGPLGSSLCEEVLDGQDVTADQVLESAQSLAMGGGPRFGRARPSQGALDQPADGRSAAAVRAALAPARRRAVAGHRADGRKLRSPRRGEPGASHAGSSNLGPG